MPDGSTTFNLFNALAGIGAVTAALVMLAVHIHTLWLNRIRLNATIEVGANRYGQVGFHRDKENVRIVVSNVCPKTLTISGIGFLDRKENNVSLVYPDKLFSPVWLNGEKLDIDEKSLVLYPSSEVALILPVTLIPGIGHMDLSRYHVLRHRYVLRVYMNTGKGYIDKNISGEILQKLLDADKEVNEKYEVSSGKQHPKYLEDCTKGLKLMLPYISSPINSSMCSDNLERAKLWLTAVERSCFQSQLGRLARPFDAPIIEGRNTYDELIQDVASGIYFIEQGRENELGEDWTIKDQFQSLGQWYRESREAESKVTEWCQIAEKKREYAYIQLTEQSRAWNIDEIRRMKAAHEENCDFCGSDMALWLLPSDN